MERWQHKIALLAQYSVQAVPPLICIKRVSIRRAQLRPVRDWRLPAA
jgi:hypothetical protein